MKVQLKQAAAVIFILGAIFGIQQTGRAQSQKQAGLVVEFGDGSLFTGCISFEGDSISGYDLLARSGLSLETAFDPSQGVAVCKIESDGCPSDECFCQMPEYWSYWNLADSGWVYAGSGSSVNRVGHGDVDGWSWGAGSPPPGVSFSQLCAPPPPPPPTNTPPPPPTDTPEPQPSDTPEPEPTDTFIPPTTTQVSSQTPLPDSPKPSPTASSTAIPSSSATSTPQLTLQSITATPSLTDPAEDPTSVSLTDSKPSQSPVISATHAASPEYDNNENGLVGYAVFGALLIGLGFALTRIVLKGRKI